LDQLLRAALNKITTATTEVQKDIWCQVLFTPVLLELKIRRARGEADADHVLDEFERWFRTVPETPHRLVAVKEDRWTTDRFGTTRATSGRTARRVACC